MTVVEDAFATMVDQFKDPLAFLRELVQNALDAGSTRIDVAVTREADLLTLEVQDTGDGMDRDIIETRLVRLFASSKDGDATKIGKFGVGFSSVFSMRPAAVVVDTARGAERWRVVFSPDGTWRLFTLDAPLEGTRVRVLKRVANTDEAVQLEGAARRTVSKWCRYAKAEIFFNGTPIAEDFTLPCPIVVRVPLVAPGDVVLVGVAAPGGKGLWGFYNKGLTLLEGEGAFDGAPPWVSFRVLDGALEHTITRDNVIRNDAFQRVLAAITAAAQGPLLDKTLEALEGDHAERDAMCAALVAPLHAKLLAKPPARAKRKVLRDARGGGLSLADVRAAVRKNAIARVDGPGALADALEKSGALVVCAHEGSGAAALLASLAGPTTSAHAELVAVLGASDKEQWQAAPLLASVKTLLKTAPALASLTDVIVARIEDRLGVLAHSPALVALDPALPIPRSTATSAPTGKRAKERVLLLNLDCPSVAAALALAATDVWLASLLLLRLALPEVAIADGVTALAAWRARGDPPGAQSAVGESPTFIRAADARPGDKQRLTATRVLSQPASIAAFTVGDSRTFTRVADARPGDKP